MSSSQFPDAFGDFEDAVEGASGDSVVGGGEEAAASGPSPSTGKSGGGYLEGMLRVSVFCQLPTTLPHTAWESWARTTSSASPHGMIAQPNATSNLSTH